MKKIAIATILVLMTSCASSVMSRFDPDRAFDTSQLPLGGCQTIPIYAEKADRKDVRIGVLYVSSDKFDEPFGNFLKKAKDEGSRYGADLVVLEDKGYETQEVYVPPMSYADANIGNGAGAGVSYAIGGYTKTVGIPWAVFSLWQHPYWVSPKDGS